MTRGALDLDRSTTLDWEALRQRVKTVGMRNSNTMAIAPTATISNICGVAQSIEPAYQNLYVKSNMSGDFTVVNAAPGARPQGARPVGRGDGLRPANISTAASAQIDRVPDDLKALYATAFEIDTRLADRSGGAPAEVDRPVAVAQPLHRQSVGQEARRAVSARLGARPEDHLLPALAQRDPCREVDAEGHRRQAQRRVRRRLRGAAAEPVALRRARDTRRDARRCSIDDPECEACQ